MKLLKPLFSLLLMLSLSFFLASCSDDDDNPTPTIIDDEEEETITRVILTFTPEDGGDAVTATWFDVDGDGGADPTIEPINLLEDEDYTLTITLANTLENPVEDKTTEISDEADEHQFFFAFTEGFFEDPEGDGNIDNRDDAVNYNDEDENGLPLGLSTDWTAGGHRDGGEFTVRLQHQPDLKSATTTATDGGTDIDITFPLNIEEDPNAEEEEITEVILTFTPDGGGTAVTARWFDADADGAGEPVIDDIELDANTTYEMSITLTNTLADPDEDITEEIEEEDDEHMFFFGFTEDIFSSPAGDGNIGDGNRNDPMNYNDEDDNGNPVGLSTDWTTGAATSGTFTVVLRHQPGSKSATSDSEDGTQDAEATFDIIIN